MKKTLFMIVAAAFTMAFAACGNKSEAPAEAAGSTEVVAEEAEAEQPMALGDIVAKAKAEGANWSVDEWKDIIRKGLVAYKPMAVAVDELMKKVGTSEAEGIDFDAEGDKIEEQYPGYEKLIRELGEVASQTANGKTVMDDQEWIDKTMEELGVPKN
jgi:hypothetical protein